MCQSWQFSVFALVYPDSFSLRSVITPVTSDLFPFFLSAIQVKVTFEMTFLAHLRVTQVKVQAFRAAFLFYLHFLVCVRVAIDCIVMEPVRVRITVTLSTPLITHIIFPFPFSNHARLPDQEAAFLQDVLSAVAREAQ